jgi:mRNA interferase HigB
LKIVGTANLLRFDGDEAAMRSVASWQKICESADWEKFLDVRRQFPSADRVGQCVVFDIRGNRYRLIAKVYFGLGLIRVVSLLTHAEYDRGGWKHACGC